MSPQKKSQRSAKKTSSWPARPKLPVVSGRKVQDPVTGEFTQNRDNEKQFNAKKWLAAFKQRQRMQNFSPGTDDPGPGALQGLKEGEIGRFIPSGVAHAQVSPCENPAPRDSFGFVGSFGEVVSKESFTPGILALRFDPKKLHGVSRETLCLFRWDLPTKSYIKVSSSGIGSGGDYVWGRITAPAKYAVIGLHANPLIIRTVAISRDLADLMAGLEPDLHQKMQDQICAMLNGSPEMRKAIEDPQVLNNLIEGSWPKGFPSPLEAWKPNPGFEGWEDPEAICPPMPFFGWPEGQLLIPGWWGGGGWVGGGPGGGGGWTPGACTDSGWQSVGPNNLSGHVMQVTIDRRSHHTLYAAAADGGIWRLGDVTRYPGMTWEPLTDQNITLRTRAVAVAPTDSSVIYMADGFGQILRSDTRGDSWAPTSATNLGYVRKIIVQPSASNVLFVASNTGFWRSRDGGSTWDNNPGLTTMYDGDVTDIGIDPGSAAILYMTVRGVGLLKSSTSGRRWQVMLAWDPTHAYWPDPATPTTTMLKLALGGLGTDANRTVVVKFGEEIFVNRFGGRSERMFGGGPWVSKGLHGGTGYGDWCHVLAVDPFNNLVILAGGQELWRTEDGGDRWNVVITYFGGEAHPDQQSLIFDTAERNVVYASNDGGVWRSVDDGRTWIDFNRDLVTGQFSRTGVAGNNAITGMYHQGIAASTNLARGNWAGIEGGAWEFSNIDGDPRRSTYFYVLGGQLNRRRWPGTGTGDFIIPFGNFPAACIAVDPRATSNTLLVGSSAPGRIMRALNGNLDAPTWTTEPGIGVGAEAIVSIAFAPSHPGMAYAVTRSGRVFRKADVNSADAWEARGTWAPGGVMQLVVNPLHEDRLYLMNGSRVDRSEDGGARWAPIPGTGSDVLPSGNNRGLVAYPFDGQTLFLAQDIGIFISPDEGLHWHPFDDDLPNAQIIEILWVGSYLYAVTGGRGLWRRSPCL